jgi:release factor glutamine methyltransferase
VVRFGNRDVMENLDGVLVALGLALQGQENRWCISRHTTPQPPPLKRRGSQGPLAR